MGTSYYKLDIENREVVGKKATKTLRRSGKVPSVLYFKGEEPLSLSVNNKALNKAMKSDQRIYEMEIDNESQYVMIKEIQYHPITDEVLHVDFMRVRRSEKMTISVPLILTGKAVGVTEGGILSQSMNQIEISCYPTNVPENIEVNIDSLELNASLSVADVIIDDDEIEIISPDELNIASIAAPKEEEEEPVLSDEAEVDSDVESSEEKTDVGEEDNSEKNENKKEG
tara:strand:- start:101 stop:781 length:681 start_codon:yes stop_codon:yes gene_type:complete